MIPRLSETTQELLRKFYAPRGWFDRFALRDDRQHILKQIELSGEVAAIPALLHIFVNENRELQYAAARAMHTLFQGLAPGDFADFDETLRRSSWSSWNYGRSTFLKAPENIQSLTIFADYSNFLLGIFACHADGYTRESALRALDDCNTGEELPFLLLRANDWVENVRTAAVNLLHKRIRAEYVPHFLRFLPLVLRLRRAGRLNHPATSERIQELFALPSACSQLEEGLVSKDAMIRRFCYGVALRTDDGNRLLGITRRALSDSDLQISLNAVKALSLAPASTDLRELIEQTLRSATPQLRLSALRLATEKYPEFADAECRRALLDRNSGVRQQAQFYLLKTGGLNVCDYYAGMLRTATPRTLPKVIAGIGEVCAKPQISLLEPHLSSPRSEVRLRAYRAIAQLDRNHPVDSFLKGLGDDSMRVVRAAAVFLRKRANSVGGERIWGIHAKLTRARQRMWTLFLVAGLTKWDSCYFLMRGLNDIDVEVSTLARKYLERWVARYNKSFVRPTKEQRERASALEEENQHLLTSAELLLFKTALRSD